MRKVLFAIAFLFVVSGIFVNKVLAVTTTTLLPVSVGNYNQWTPSTGTTHYTLVDESSCNGNTDYNSTTTVGNRDSYGVSLSSIPNTATITAIAITPCASRVNSGGTAPVMKVFYRLDGVNSADSGSYSLSGTTPVNLSATSFSGLSIAKTGSTTLEVGAVLTSGTKGAKLSRIGTVITYTVPAPVVTTDSATSVGTNTATLNSTVNPNGTSTNVYYRYGLSNVACASLSSSTSGTLIGSGTSDVSPISRGVNSLSSSSTYYFCAVGTNTGGTTYGNVLSFTTLP